MITEKNHKLLTSQLFVTDCTKKGLASMYYQHVETFLDSHSREKCVYKGKCVSTLIKGKHDTWLARGFTKTETHV